MQVKVDNLRKTYGKTTAVDDISFAFDSGHIFGFVGPNGAGKTTTMRIMATLMEPDAGDVLIGGVSSLEEPEEVRRRISFVPDSLPAHRDVTVHEYIEFFGRAYGLRGQRLRSAVADVVEFTGLGNLRHKTLHALSKGMKQRVSVGRALVHDPPVLLLDEPAAGLDPRARVELRELLAALAEQKKAILISSHILTELTEICDGVVIIEKGRILETGAVHEIVGRLRRHLALTIRTLGRVEDVYAATTTFPGVLGARIEGASLSVELDGDEEKAADLVAYLVRSGHRLAEFHQEKVDLEDIFMSITQGDLQ
jgi:ABC-2 type transport system ATP-binding protein